VKRTHCRSCGSLFLQHVIDLGDQPPSNALTLRGEPQKAYPLSLVVCETCWLMQTGYDVPHKELFTEEYPYFSGQSEEWVAHCKKYAEEMTERLGLGPSSYVIEIGGNDGTLLKNFRCHKLNVEPCANVAAASSAAGVPTYHVPWGRHFDLLLNADLIVANNVLAHDPDINGFIGCVKRNLGRNGIATFEFPWALNLIKNAQFDTIYHEHYSYLTLTALEPLFRRHGLVVFDVDQLATHGGSLRIYVCHDRVQARYVPAEERVCAVLDAERVLRDPGTYERFAEEVEWICYNAHLLVGRHGPMWGYGAAAKGSVFLNYCGFTSTSIHRIADTTAAKQGKVMPGSCIPIVPEEELIAAQPEWVLILAWNWKREIIQRLRPKLPRTKFVCAIPELTVSESYITGTPL